MKFSDIIGIAVVSVFIISVIVGFVILIYSTERYYELKSTINDCNKDFGEGNWVFKERDSYLSCQSIQTIKSVSSSSTCSINGVNVDCSLLK